MNGTDQQVTNGGELRISKKRIEGMRGRLEDQALELSRLALDLNQRRAITVVVVKRLLFTVQSLDLEIRELNGIEAGQLR
jgi:hypothetical protein